MGGLLEKLLAGVVSSLIMFALVGALVWFGGRDVIHSYLEGQRAIALVPQLQATIVADRTAADSAQASCDARVASSVKSAATIARISAPQLRAPGAAQPTIDADAIRSLVQ